MPLQTSGAISLNDMHIEAGGSSGTQVSINDQDIRDLISKSSGAQMSFSEWYGASSSPVDFSTISSPTRNTQTASFNDLGYLRNNSNSNKDVIMFGGIISGSLQYGSFGTNNRRSTWSNGGTVSYGSLPSQYSTSGNRAFSCKPITGTDKFVVITENWLGYSTGTNVAMYQWDGSSSSSPSRIGSWSSIFGNQSSFGGMVEDRKRPGNFIAAFSYLHNVPNYFRWHFIPFRVDPSSGSVTSYYQYFVTPDDSSYLFDIEYYDGRLVYYYGANSGRNQYVGSARFNTSGGWVSGYTNGTSGQNNFSNHTYSGYSNQNIKNLHVLGDGTWVLAGHLTGSGTPTHLHISRLTFTNSSSASSSDTVTLNNTTQMGLSQNGTQCKGYLIGEPLDTSADSIYLGNYDSYSGRNSEEVWQWTGSSFSKTFETSHTGTDLKDIVSLPYSGTKWNPSYKNQGVYTNDDKVLSLENDIVMPYYWSNN